MAIKIKVASTPSELDDVYRLRYDVYVIDDNKFDAEKMPDQRLIDRFDAIGNVASIIAYEGDVAIGTIRLNKDSAVGLPSEELFDFSRFREHVKQERGEEGVIVSCGMLCVHPDWRRKREVIFALFKMAIGIGLHWSTTHSFATVSKETTSLYGRMGYEPIGEPVWVEEIGNQIIPMVANYEKIHQWAFESLIDSQLDMFWLDSFAGHFERVLLAPGETLFTEGEDADSAFIVDEGWLALSRTDPDGQQLTLATMGKGALFGELALIDESVRSASAIASTFCELIRIDREVFNNSIKSDEAKAHKLLKAYAQRIRETDDLVMVMAFAPQTGRVKFALEQLKSTAIPDKKNDNCRIAKIGPVALAQTAGVREHEVLRVLELEKSEGRIDYGKNVIRFYCAK